MTGETNLAVGLALGAGLGVRFRVARPRESGGEHP